MPNPTLRIVAVNDVYTLENLPRLRSLVAHHAAVDPADRLLVTLAGDFVAPSVLSSLDSGRGMVDCMNAVGFTHVCLGNHEDDIATPQLRARLAELTAICLTTNVRDLDPSLPAHDLVEVGGRGGVRRVRVGLVGVVMMDPSIFRRPPFGGGAILPPGEAARAEASRLLMAGCATVIPLTHQPIADDRALACASPASPFPVIVGGHEHEVARVQACGTWIVKAGSDAVHALVIDLEWPPAAPEAGADLPSVRVRLEDTARYPEDPSVRARVDVHMGRVRALETAVLLRLREGETLSSVGTRVRQTSMGTLLCDRVRDALGADACLWNGGGIRGARVYASHVTYGDLETECPFDNEIVVARLPGGVVREAVAFSRRLSPVESPGFLQVDGGTIVDGANTVVAIGGAPLDAQRVYRVALVRDLLAGLDHVEPLVRFAAEHPEAMPPAGSGRDVKVVLVDAFSVALWRELGGFDAVDVDHDGVVTRSELAAAIARRQGEPPSELTAELVIHALDADKDKVITRAEADTLGRPPPDVAPSPELPDSDLPDEKKRR